MNTTLLLIYDNTGKVWGIYSDVTSVPDGVQGIIVTNAPTSFKSVYVNPTTKEVVWELAPVTEDEVTNLQEALLELEERVATLEGGN